MRGVSLRQLLCWLAPSAGVGTLAAQDPTPAEENTGIVVDTMAAVTSKYLQTPRMVRVFLPPGYGRDIRRYPVLYANDGQDMEAVGLPNALDSLLASGGIEPFIVVAIHATTERLQEYGTSGTASARGLGSKAQAYESFLVQELIPLINRRYRTLSGPTHTSIMGWSLGGLSAFNLAWRNSNLIGAVGTFSGSFWWRSDDASPASKQSSRISHRTVRESSEVPGLRIWFEAGRQDETDDRDGNGVIDAIQDTRELMDELRLRGFREGREMVYVEVDGGHNQETWGKVLPEFLVWAFGKQP